eukprot:Nk52_evm13s369 gene=Nk52_evmTU13s369
MSERTFLFCVDDSENSTYAFQYIKEHILKAGDKMVILHVAPPVSASREKVLAESTANAENVIKHFQKLGTNFGLKAETLIVNGDPKELIPSVINEKKPTMLIMGSYGLGHRGRVRLGSVCEHVSNCCPCPLLIVRNPVVEKVETASFDTKWPDEKVPSNL